jgi:hypothetical protein
MSRGFGRLERGVMALIEGTGKPMTFVAIRTAMETKSRPTFDERSLRRALHRLTEKCMLIAMGNGGPGDPLRYFFQIGLAARARPKLRFQNDSGLPQGPGRRFRWILSLQ